MRRFTSVVGWASLAVLTLTGLAGAAHASGGILLGIPATGDVVLVVAGISALVAVCGVEAGQPLAGLLPLVLWLAAGAPLAGARALSGPPLLAVAAGGVVLVLSRARLSVARALFFPCVLIAYLTVAARVQARVGPEGDEPHYLMVAASLLRDHDLNLEQDYAEGRYRSFHPKDLAPHFRVRGRGGEVYSLHAIGLSLLVLPAYALGGYPAVSYFMALLAALLALQLRSLLRTTAASAWADGLAWVFALSPPIIHYAGLVFTEIPAALVVALALGKGRDVDGGKAVALGAAIALLPWLNVRYAALALILLAFAAAGAQWRRVARLFLPTVISFGGLALFHSILYGFADPRRVYGRAPELALSNLPEGVSGLLLDQEFGLLVYAPVFVLAIPGWISWLREQKAWFLTSAALVAIVLLVAGAWPMWRGGFNPPARFLVPIVPVLAAAAAAHLRKGIGVAAALLIGWGLWTGLAGGISPELVHRDRDGTAPLFRSAAGAEEWTRLLPGYVLEDPDRHRLALVWAAALAAAAAAAATVTLERVAVVVTAFALFAAGAATQSHARTDGRDAVRLLGRRALLLPSLEYRPVADARWGPDDLEWGSLYEPHRFPDGAVLGGRLPLAPGHYRLRIEGEALGPPGTLEVRSDLDIGNRTPLSADLAADFEVSGSPRGVTLRLRDGGPLEWRGVTLTRLEAPR